MVGGMPPKKSIESINKANSPKGRTVGPSGMASNPYDPRRLSSAYSKTVPVKRSDIYDGGSIMGY